MRQILSARAAARGLVVMSLLMASTPAWALKLCLIDFQKAVTETAEGKSAQTKIDGMYSSRKAELERMQKELEKAIQDYQSRAMILSAEAKAGEEQKLGLQQKTFEQTYMNYQNEMQQTYMGLLGDLDEKMRAVAQVVGKEQGCTTVIDKAVVIYAGAEMADVTTTLVTKYNAQHPPKP
jgi:Skp family chaperone for outer membrane proteins